MPGSTDRRSPAPAFTCTAGRSDLDLTPFDVARKFGHERLAEEMLSRASLKTQLLDALWTGDRERVHALLTRDAELAKQLGPEDFVPLPAAAWWYRPKAVRLMLELGFDPHTRGPHRSTPLDRAAFHGYADIVEMLLTLDPHPPLTEQNEFGGMPLGACLYGSLNGWKTGFPQDHARTVQLLLEAGSTLDPNLVPIGNDAVDSVLRDWIRTRHDGIARS